jgi:hypothetical protein
MGNILLTLGIVGTGCTSQVGEVKEVGPGTYSIGVSRALGGGMLQGNEALKATVDKAGEHCHAKGQKLSNARAVDNKIIFRCVSGEPKPQ